MRFSKIASGHYAKIVPWSKTSQDLSNFGPKIIPFDLMAGTLFRPTAYVALVNGKDPVLYWYGTVRYLKSLGRHPFTSVPTRVR